jgi:glucose/arabinose dehydrogenase
LRDDISLRKVAEVGAANIRIAQNPQDGELYYLHPENGIYHVNLETGDTDRVIARTDVVTNGVIAGMTYAPDGTLYLVVNQDVPEKMNRAVVRKGALQSDGSYAWTTVAQTEPYPLAGNNFDHYANGIVLSPDGQFLFINSGSRSDHGEIETNGGAFDNTREVPLTSALLRIPASSQDLILPADPAGLAPYLYADGLRNSYDPVFAPNGDLFSGENGPDADFPDELNWVREGLHYGFPWKFGLQDNPQRDPNYNPNRDVRLQAGFFAVDNNFYKRDPDFPPPPEGVTFTEPVVNRGPDADHYRGDDGSEMDASEQRMVLHTFTPHRAPLGLAFVTDPTMPSDLQGSDTTLSALLTGWGAAAGTLSDRGADLLHMQLTKNGDNYEGVTRILAHGFNLPVDGVLVGNKYYLLEWGQDGAIWELTFAQ